MSRQPLVAALGIFAVLASTSCGTINPAAQAEPSALRDGTLFAHRTGTAIFNIVIPAHPPLPKRPHFVSPATQGVEIQITSPGRKASSGFFALAANQPYCTRGSSALPLSCRLELKAPAATDTFTLTTYAGPTVRSSILARGVIVATIAASAETTLNVAMGGVIAFLQAAIDDPYVPWGSPATVPVRITAADAYGYTVVGKYDKPITVRDSDAGGATHLSESRIKTSGDAARLFVRYTGAKLGQPMAIVVETPTVNNAATASFYPGHNGIVANPALLVVPYDGRALLQLAGPGAQPPFRVVSQAASCGRIVQVRRLQGAFVITGKALGACLLIARDRDAHQRAVPVLVSMPATLATPSPNPSPPVDASPSSVTLCPTSGAQQCGVNSYAIAVSQANFGGAFSESDTCSAAVASVTTSSEQGPDAVFTVTGGSATGTCRATFTGDGGKETGVAIVVTGPGVGIDLNSSIGP